MKDLETLSIPDAKLIQIALRELGLYTGTTAGMPGPKTKAAYKKYLKGFDEADEYSATENPIPAILTEILKKEVGVREIGSSNTGVRVREYQDSTDLGGTNWPWCAALICWGLLQTSKKTSLPFKRPKTAGAWAFEQWARDEGLKLMKPRETIKKGDIVVYRFSHIGLAIADESNKFVECVEGNTDGSGGREGGGVYQRSRKVSLIRSHIRLELI